MNRCWVCQSPIRNNPGQRILCHRPESERCLVAPWLYFNLRNDKSTDRILSSAVPLKSALPIRQLCSCRLACQYSRQNRQYLHARSYSEIAILYDSRPRYFHAVGPPSLKHIQLKDQILDTMESAGRSPAAFGSGNGNFDPFNLRLLILSKNAAKMADDQNLASNSLRLRGYVISSTF